LSLKEAKYYEKIENKLVKCNLCPHNCIIKDGTLGICNSRKNINGTLYTVNYGKLVSMSLDPIEKKPLNNFYPGSKILSVGTYGCNLKCDYCQNWEISQKITDTHKIKPEKIIEIAKKEKKFNNIGIAYTYNEPSIWYEFVYDTAKLARNYGLLNVMVSNGFIEKKPLKNLIKYIDAMNIDLKAFNNDFYNNICGCDIDNVLRNIEYLWDKCHLEITILIVPTLNDDVKEFENLVKWISKLSIDIPFHITRYFPRYKMNIQFTPIEILEKLKKIALKYLKNVYIGNI
jgi:pyruvate formate lyase activating enzyme